MLLPDRATSPIVVVGVAVLVMVIALLDFGTSANFVGSILFTLPLALCALQRSTRLLWITATSVAVLTLASEWWGFDRVAESDVGLFNRMLLVASLATLAGFIHLSLRKNEVQRSSTAEIELQRRSLENKNEKLVQMEARYRGLLEAAPDAMIVVDRHGDIVHLNAQAESKFGYRRDELLGKQVIDIIPIGFAERLIADGTRSAAEALAQHIGTGIELDARRKDGSSFPMELMLSPLEGEDGILVTAAIRDVSVRNAAKRHLAHMEGRYRGLLEAAPDAMLLVSQAGAVVLVNRAAEILFGYSRGELEEQSPRILVSADSTATLISYTRRTADGAYTEQSGLPLELDGRRKDQTGFPIEVMLSHLETSEGILLTVSVRDITTRRRAQAALVATMLELERSNAELEQFAYVASHDLQEPLRMVASYTQLLAKRYKGKLDADADEFIAFAVGGANRMQRLIQDLLAYSRVHTKGQGLESTSSELALERATTSLRTAIATAGALVTHGPLPTVMADQSQLVQLFQNLVGNAIKYQSTGGVPTVHVSSIKDGDDKWRFSVQDNGIGIEAQYFDKIFGMFQRLHKREEFEGSGIGLAICKKIVERHGSHISVESQPGQGSTFRFALTGSEGTV